MNVSDLEASVDETEDLITVLDNDVTEMDALVTTLQEENVQLQQTVGLLLQRVAVLEATLNATDSTLSGKIYLKATLKVTFSSRLSTVVLHKLLAFNGKKSELHFILAKANIY